MAECPACRTSLDNALRCPSCGRRFALVPAEEPRDAQDRLLAALGAARDPDERARIRSVLSNLLADQARDDLLLAIWADVGDDPEADLWRGAAAVIGQPATTLRAVPALERAAMAFAASGRTDLLAVARSYLIMALLSEARVAEAERVGHEALVAAIEARDAGACLRSAFTLYVDIEYHLRLRYREAEQGLERAAAIMRSWDPRRAQRLGQARTRIVAMAEPLRARRLIAELGVGPDPIARANDLRARANVAIACGEVEEATVLLTALLADPAPGSDTSERPRAVALRRADLANVDDRPEDAIRLLVDAMPPPWHRSCYLRVEARWARAEALARLLPREATTRRARAAARAVRRAERFGAADIYWREMRWRLLAGELYRSIRQRRDAVRELSRARAIARQLDLAVPLATIEAHLRALGALGPRTGNDGTPTLTAREREIAHLITGGATNDDIARRLVVSPATVARHVSNMLTRLDLRNRREIAAHVRRSADLHIS